MRIATWNINSVRVRVERALEVLARHDLDVLLLQETKVVTEKFPREAFEQAGYQVAAWGLNQWNGVAIISRVGLEDVQLGFPGQPQFGEPEVTEARALGATCGGVRVWSLYVPNGREITHPHYTYKLGWLEQLRQQAQGWLAADPALPLLLAGDWNVVPTDVDVWSMVAFEGKTHVTVPERSAFDSFAQEGLEELTRRFLPAPHTYTYWDYVQLRFPKNEGMRIDFGYASPALAARATAVEIDRNERKGKGASDHVPVIFEFADDDASRAARTSHSQGAGSVTGTTAAGAAVVPAEDDPTLF